MAKILRIEYNNIIVGLDDGSTINANRDDFDFDIQEFMSVDVYKHSDKYIFSPSSDPNQAEFEPEIYGKIYVNKQSYGLLCILLGLWGVHEFSVGNFKAGSLFAGITVGFFIFCFAFLGVGINELSASLFLIYMFVYLAIAIYLFIRGIIILCSTANRNGNIVISKW